MADLDPGGAGVRVEPVGERVPQSEDATPEAVLGLKHGDIMPGLPQFIRRRKSGKAAANYDDLFGEKTRLGGLGRANVPIEGADRVAVANLCFRNSRRFTG